MVLYEHKVEIKDILEEICDGAQRGEFSGHENDQNSQNLQLSLKLKSKQCVCLTSLSRQELNIPHAFAGKPLSKEI